MTDYEALESRQQGGQRPDAGVEPAAPGGTARERLREVGFAEGQALVSPAGGAVSGDADAAPDLGGTLLRWGSQGPLVEACQGMLNRQGASLAADGIFGPLTHAAVIAFQAAHALGVDGIVGPMTWGSLKGAPPSQTTPPGTQPGSAGPPSLAGLAEALLGTLAAPGVGALLGGLLAPSANRAADAVRAADGGGLMLREGAPADGAMGITEGVTGGQDPGKQMIDRWEAVQQGMGVHLTQVANVPVALPMVPPGVSLHEQLADHMDRLVQAWAPYIAAWRAYATGGNVPKSESWDTSRAMFVLSGIEKRLSSMRTFYDSMAPAQKYAGHTPGSAADATEVIPAQTTVTDGRRLAMVGLALAEIGKVRANEYNGVDEAGGGARTGWMTLKEYYDTAFEKPYPEQDLLRRGPIIGKTAVSGKFKGRGLPHWCGIFSVWAGHKANLAKKPWKLGHNADAVYRRRAATEMPQVGDVVYTGTRTHHSIITGITYDGKPVPAGKTTLLPTELAKVKFVSVDGNTGVESTVAQRGEKTLSTDFAVMDTTQSA